MFTDTSAVPDLLNAFEETAREFPAAIPWCVDLGPKQSKFTTVFGSAIHGNETGSLPAVLSILSEMAEEFQSLHGRYIFFVGNPDAVHAGTRFIERDLNRCFNLTDSATLEGKRSIELSKILAEADLFIDYHQTNQPAVFPFFTFAYHEESYRWAAHMQAADHFVTRDMKVAFSSEGLCGDEWVRARGKSAVTLELGRAGLSHSAFQTTLNSLRRIVGFVETELSHGRLPAPAKPASGEDLKFFQVAAKLPWTGDEAALIDGFENFQFVNAGDELGQMSKDVKLTAPVSGHLMFPKYPKRNADGKPLEPQGGDIVQIVQAIAAHPRELWV
jgi:succinylglutamate desuccinylase